MITTMNDKNFWRRIFETLEAVFGEEDVDVFSIYGVKSSMSFSFVCDLP
ncbi:hypothetical protein ABID23_000329 [Bartonella silvatica]|uniref:Uncharacterized protein n=1 Tax=Bartonella silvatica TaxID=357760 RepID=A0ABV2HFC8_9HYPH